MISTVAELFLLIRAALPARGPLPNDADFDKALDAIGSALEPQTAAESIAANQLLRALSQARQADAAPPEPNDRSNAAALRFRREADRAVSRAIADFEKLRSKRPPAPVAAPQIEESAPAAPAYKVGSWRERIHLDRTAWHGEYAVVKGTALRVDDAYDIMQNGMSPEELSAEFGPLCMADILAIYECVAAGKHVLFDLNEKPCRFYDDDPAAAPPPRLREGA